MKIYSDTNVSKTDLDHVDAKQSEQIKKLRLVVGASFIANVFLSVALFFIK